MVSEDENEDDKLLMATGGYNAADLQRSYPEVIEGVGESLSGVDESLSGDIKSLKRLIYGAHAQVGALTMRLDKQDARLEGVVETKTASTALYRSSDLPKSEVRPVPYILFIKYENGILSCLGGSTKVR